MPLKESLQPINTGNLPSKFIFIGEDDLDDVDLLREAFNSIDNSFELLFFYSGSHIIESLQALPEDKLPCIIVLDYNMPELNGAEILKRLKGIERFNPVPKVIWSTSGSVIYRKMCLELGANDYVTKPSSLHEFSQIARHILSFC